MATVWFRRYHQQHQLSRGGLSVLWPFIRTVRPIRWLSKSLEDGTCHLQSWGNSGSVCLRLHPCCLLAYFLRSKGVWCVNMVSSCKWNWLTFFKFKKKHLCRAIVSNCFFMYGFDYIWWSPSTPLFVQAFYWTKGNCRNLHTLAANVMEWLLLNGICVNLIGIYCFWSYVQLRNEILLISSIHNVTNLNGQTQSVLSGDRWDSREGKKWVQG